jgi:hypothetical protein
LATARGTIIAPAGQGAAQFAGYRGRTGRERHHAVGRGRERRVALQRCAESDTPSHRQRSSDFQVLPERYVVLAIVAEAQVVGIVGRGTVDVQLASNEMPPKICEPAPGLARLEVVGVVRLLAIGIEGVEVVLGRFEATASAFSPYAVIASAVSGL